jgi:hypothetical protein
MYSGVGTSVNVSTALTLASWLVASALLIGHSPENRTAESCDPVFAVLFTPPHPRMGRYEVCTRKEPLTSLIRPEWRVEATSPLDAFGSAGLYDRAAVARLYGGRRPAVARGWIDEPGRFESLTLISPHPDAALTRLEPGTLIIRFILCCT